MFFPFAPLSFEKSGTTFSGISALLLRGEGWEQVMDRAPRSAGVVVPTVRGAPLDRSAREASSSWQVMEPSKQFLTSVPLI